jgi:hypothetical protein
MGQSVDGTPTFSKEEFSVNLFRAPSISKIHLCMNLGITLCYGKDLVFELD